jgi:hypothetical protein
MKTVLFAICGALMTIAPAVALNVPDQKPGIPDSPRPAVEPVPKLTLPEDSRSKNHASSSNFPDRWMRRFLFLKMPCA